MKRDIQLARKIAFAIESEPDGSIETVAIEGYSPEQIRHHLSLMSDGGLLEKFVTFTTYYSLKWKGHDFTNAVRNNVFWAKALSDIKTKIVSTDFDTLMSYLRTRLQTQSLNLRIMRWVMAA